MQQNNKLTLASGSAIRAHILRSAGLDFAVHPPAMDEARHKEHYYAKHNCAGHGYAGHSYAGHGCAGHNYPEHEPTIDGAGKADKSSPAGAAHPAGLAGPAGLADPAGVAPPAGVAHPAEKHLYVDHNRPCYRPDCPQQSCREIQARRHARHLGQELAYAKAATAKTEGLIIGADQILVCREFLLDKPQSLAQARQHLCFLRGRTHMLYSHIVLLRGEHGQAQGQAQRQERGQTQEKGQGKQKNRPIWAYCARARLTMHDFSDKILDDYLEQAGEQILSSVGCYRLEAGAAHLFAKIEGDYWAILGLPLLPLLKTLRQQEAFMS